MGKETLKCPKDSRYRVELDASEAYPNDPGQGTPAMVYGPKGASATFFCALDTGEMDSHEGPHEIPSNIYRWLESVEERVDGFVSRAFEDARARAAGGGV